MAIEFDGSNDYIDVGNWNVSGDKITCMAWVYVHSTPNDPRVISKSNDTSYQMFCLLVNGTDTVGWRIVGPGSTDRTILNTSQQLSMNTWYHLTGVYDGSQMRIYINAEQKASVSKSGNIYQNSDPIWIGGNATSATQRPFDGLIEDVRVYNRDLSLDEIQTIYQVRGNDGIVDGLEARWPLNEGSYGLTVPNTADQVKDVSGNNRHGGPDGSNPVYRCSQLRFKRKLL